MSDKPALTSIDGGKNSAKGPEQDEQGRLTKRIRGLRHWIYRVHLQAQDGENMQTDYDAPWNPDKEFITPQSVGEACAAAVTVGQKKKFIALPGTHIRVAEAAA